MNSVSGAAGKRSRDWGVGKSQDESPRGIKGRNVTSVPLGIPLSRVSTSGGLGVPRNSASLGRGSNSTLMQNDDLFESRLQTLVATHRGAPVLSETRGLTGPVSASTVAPMQDKSSLLSLLKAAVGEGDLHGSAPTLAPASPSAQQVPLSIPLQRSGSPSDHLGELRGFLGIGQNLSTEPMQHRPLLGLRLKTVTANLDKAAPNSSASNMSGVVPSKNMVSLGAREIAQNLANNGMTADALALLANNMAGRALGTGVVRRPTRTEGIAQIQKLANIPQEAASALMVSGVGFSEVTANLKEITAAAGRWEQPHVVDSLRRSLAQPR